MMGGERIPLVRDLAALDFCLAMTQYSATAPLFRIARDHPGFRAASMPGVLRRMEQTALAADYREVARKAAILQRLLDDAVSARLTFSTGHELGLDLRFRSAKADNGQCRAGAEHRIINLPSGEAFIVPYEGEREGEPSGTAGRIPVVYGAEQVEFEVSGNRIRKVHGDGAAAARMDAFFQEDPARANVAELGLGCNDRAVVAGAVLEDEKAGLHWAYGRSEHLGGVIGPDCFAAPANVVHQDIVYATGCPLGVRALVLTSGDGTETRVMQDNRYLVF
jgi:leucyl aminopeptidase (aminopeptidase T)